MNKLVVIGVGLAALSVGAGMLLTGSASASSSRDVGTVQIDADPTADPTQPCVVVGSAVVEAPDGAIVVEQVGEPLDSFDMAAGSTWHSVSVDADGNITTDEGTADDLPTEFDVSAGDTSRVLVNTAVAAPTSGADGGIDLGGPCQP